MKKNHVKKLVTTSMLGLLLGGPVVTLAAS